MPTNPPNPNVLGALLGRSRSSLFEEVLGTLTGISESSAPEGYEDETGFHFSGCGVNSCRLNPSQISAGETH
jgi:hypothetical protein